jgi:hypothetical protein
VRQIQSIKQFGARPNHQTSHFCAHPQKSIRPSCAHPLQSIRPFCAHSLLSAKQNAASSPLYIALGSSSLHCVHSCGPLLPHPLLSRPAGTTHPSTSFVYGVLKCSLVALVRTFGDNPGSQTKSRSSVSLRQFLNFFGFGENRIQISASFRVAR